MSKDLSKFFKPNSIAIYGVSTDSSKIASTIFYNLIDSKFPGKIHPINPKYKEINGYECFADAKSIPTEVDMAIMAVPGNLAMQILDDCIAKQIKNLIIISAGFAETGEEGKLFEEDLIKKANAAGINVLGPNCLGVIITESKMNASFAASNALDGNIAFISQSGAVCTSMLDIANDAKVGFSHLISIGNKAVLNENDLMETLLKDKNVNVIGAYLEEFEDGNVFCNFKKNLSLEKPIVVLSPGQTEAAQNAIRSHTGSLASSTRVISTALRKNGIIRANTIAQMFSLLVGFSFSKLPQGENVAIVTNAGGAGIVATDGIANAGLKIAQISEDSKTKLKEALPVGSSIRNPIDILGDARADRYELVLNTLIEDPNVDSILLILSPQLVTEIEITAKTIININRKSSKPIIPVFIGGEYTSSGLHRMHNNKIPSFSDLSLGVYVLDKLTEYSIYLRNKRALHTDFNMLPSKKHDLSKYLSDSLVTLPENEIQGLLKEFEVTTPKTEVVSTFDEAKNFITNSGIGFPVVIKATAEQILHKTDTHAVFLNIKDEEELGSRIVELQENIKKSTGQPVENFLIQEQIVSDAEFFIGIKRDGNYSPTNKVEKGFGFLMAFGTGGIYTEVYEDISFGLLPLSLPEIYKLIDSTKISKVINGFRGNPPLARAKIVELIQKIQKMITTYPEIAEIDINPAMANSEKCVVTDAKILVKK